MKTSKDKVVDIDDLLIDVNLDLNELFKRTFSEPIIDVNETLEETMERFFNELPSHRLN